MIGGAIKRIIGVLLFPFKYLIKKQKRFQFLDNTLDYQCHVNFKFWFIQKVLRIGNNHHAYWPVHYTSQVTNVENIVVGVDAYPGFMRGCYIQGMGGIEIGDFTQIAPNVIIVSSNHDLYDSRIPVNAPIKIGKYCWIGAGVKIMPGVTLGDWTIVGAGAVVTKSFSDGHCVIGGVPAYIIKELDRSKCIPFDVKKRFHGYLSEEDFLKLK